MRTGAVKRVASFVRVRSGFLARFLRVYWRFSEGLAQVLFLLGVRG